MGGSQSSGETVGDRNSCRQSVEHADLLEWPRGMPFLLPCLQLEQPCLSLFFSGFCSSFCLGGRQRDSTGKKQLFGYHFKVRHTVLRVIKTVETKETDTLSSCLAKVGFFAKPQAFCLHFLGSLEVGEWTPFYMVPTLPYLPPPPLLSEYSLSRQSVILRSSSFGGDNSLATSKH